VSEEVDNFLEHFGVVGMKWGKHKAQSDDRSSQGSGGADLPRQKMSRNKKIAIAVGVGATVAIGAAIAISILNSKNQQMELPVHMLHTNKTMLKGKANLIFKAAAMPHQAPAVAPVANKVAEKVTRASKKAAAAAVAAEVPGKPKLLDKVKDKALAKAKDMAFEKAKEQAIEKAKGIALDKAKSMLPMNRPVAEIPAKVVVFNPKTGLYEEHDAQPDARENAA
jgi:hypothetical protein